MTNLWDGDFNAGPPGTRPTLSEDWLTKPVNVHVWFDHVTQPAWHPGCSFRWHTSWDGIEIHAYPVPIFADDHSPGPLVEAFMVMADVDSEHCLQIPVVDGITDLWRDELVMAGVVS